MRPSEGRAALAALGANPRVRVSAVVPFEDGIVLARHVKNGRTYHLLPGGGVEANESIEHALKRELSEETGLECELVAPLFINDTIAPDGSRHVVNLTFLARAVGGTLTRHPLDARVEGVDVVEISALQAIDLRPPMSAALTAAAKSDFTAPARYLGELWSPEDRDGFNGTEQEAASGG